MRISSILTRFSRFLQRIFFSTSSVHNQRAHFFEMARVLTEQPDEHQDFSIFDALKPILSVDFHDFGIISTFFKFFQHCSRIHHFHVIFQFYGLRLPGFRRTFRLRFLELAPEMRIGVSNTRRVFGTLGEFNIAVDWDAKRADTGAACENLVLQILRF